MMIYEHTTYFPDESFDAEASEEDNQQEVFSQLYTQLSHARQEVLDRHGVEWTKEYELALAANIQDGIQARTIAEAMGAEYDSQFDDVIEQGNQAHSDLVTINLPFAIYMARASTGRRKVPQANGVTAPSVPRKTGEYNGSLKDIGTYAPISNLASPHAQLEDRMQVAMEAMWTAAEKFKPNQNRNAAKQAKFTTFASWHIQAALHRFSMSEVSGWDVSNSIFEKYMNALNEEALYGALPIMSHTVEGHGRHAGLHPRQMLEGRRTTSIEDVVTEDLEDVDALDEPNLLTLEDIVPDKQSLTTLDAVSQRALEKQIDAVLLSLRSERNMGIIALRFGLGDDAPQTLDRIGKQYGVTKERIRELESRTMSLLRHPSRSQVLRDYLDTLKEDFNLEQVLDIADGAPNIRTKRIVMEEPDSIEAARTLHKKIDRDPDIADWQLTSDDAWDDDVRHTA